MTIDSTFEAKVVLLGAAAVGKTSLLARATDGEFTPDRPATVGASYTTKRVKLDQAIAQLQVWDTAGQERFRTLAPMFYRGAMVCILVFSVTEPQSLTDVRKWAEEVTTQLEDVPAFVIVGNKVDLEDERLVTPAVAQAVADDLNAEYCEASAKTGQGISDIFRAVAQKAFDKRNAQKKDETEPRVEIATKKKKKKKQGLC
jgi:Ras-related protein Rab-5C